MIDIKSTSLRDDLLKLGLYHFRKSMVEEGKTAPLMESLDRQLTVQLPQQLAVFRAIRDAPGASERANFATVERAVTFLETKISDLTLVRQMML